MSLKLAFSIPPNTLNRGGSIRCAWNVAGTFLAVCGNTGVARIYDRNGSQVAEAQLESRAQCLCLDWDNSGEAVVILQTGVERVAVFEVVPAPSLLYVDTGFKDPTVAAWSRAGPQLAVASATGALVLFRRDTRKRVPILGKHSGSITCAAWSRDGRLALGSDDKTLSVSTAEGDTVDTLELRATPLSVEWSAGEGGGEGAPQGGGAGSQLLEPTLSCNQGGRTVMLHNSEGPLELAFSPRYGRVVAYTGFGEGRYMLLGFSEGYVVIIATTAAEVGVELFSNGRLLKEPLAAVAVSGDVGRAAVAGGSTVRFIDTGSWTEVGGGVAAATPPAAGPIEVLKWAGDGALLTAATREGGVFTFVARPPLLVAAGGGRLAFASSLRDITVVGALAAAGAAADAEARGGGDATAPGAPSATPFSLHAGTVVSVEAPVEPSVIAVGPYHVGAAANNRAWFWEAVADGGGAAVTPLGEVAYPGSVDALLVGAAHSVALCGGRVFLRALGGDGGAALNEEGARITALALAKDYLFTGDAAGCVRVYALGAGRYLPGAVLRLGGSLSVAGLAPNCLGTRAVVIDSAGGALLFNPVDGSAVAVAPAGASSSGVRALWDCTDPSVFALAALGAAAGAAAAAPASGGRGSRAGSVGADGEDGARRAGGLALGGARVGGGGGGGGGGAPPCRLSAYHFSHTTINPGCAPAVSVLGPPTMREDGSIFMEPGSVAAPAGTAPVAFVDGRALFASPGGALFSVTMPPFDGLHAPSGRATRARTTAALLAAVMLGRFGVAWAAAGDLAAAHGDFSGWRAIAGKAMEVMDIPTARRAYAELGSAAEVQSLELIAEGPQERRVVAGSLNLLFGDFDTASDHFLQSPTPELALTMRRDLLQWDTAAELAAKVSPAALPELHVEMARAAEWRGDNASALALYARAEASVAEAAGGAGAPRGGGAPASALPPAPRAPGAAPQKADPAAPLPPHAAAVKAAARAGVARCTLRAGDVRKGVSLALACGGRALLHECGDLAARLGAKAEAAALFLAGEYYDRAGDLFLAAGNLAALAPIVAKLTSRRVLRGYAGALEAAGDAEGAARAYEMARDTEAVVRLLVGRLNALPRAKEVVRATRSREGAAIVADACVRGGDVPGAVAFLLLSRARDAAFALAAERGHMGVYVRSLVGEDAGGGGGAVDVAALAPAALARLPRAECLRVGAYYESGGGKDPFLAATMYSAAGAHARALQLLLGVLRGGAGGEEGADSTPGAAAIAAAIRVAGAARDPSVTSALLAYLTGAEDGLPKDGRHVYALYLALGNYAAAAATALVIARAETDTPSGVIKTAHGVLFDAHVALAGAGAHVPAELRKLLSLLHSYTLVKRLVAGGEHEGAARVIARVARNISRFPAQATTILTSAVVCCQRGGMKASAFEFACALMGPSHKCPDGVREDLRKKIEAMVRRPTTEPDAPDALTPCPFCDAPVPAYALACAACQSVIPYCIISGKHMTVEDCSQCPSCKFPALHGHLAAWAAGRAGGDGACTMCYAPIAPQSVTLLRDPAQFLKAAAGVAGDAAAGGGSS